MASFVLTVFAAILLCAVAVSGENCQAAQAEAQSQCGGIGCRQVQCDGDDFQATQCVGSMCNCVQTDGTQIGSYVFPIANYGDCQCARDELSGSNFGSCGTNGSY